MGRRPLVPQLVLLAARLEEGLVIGLFSLLLFCALLQIVLRFVFGTGLAWIDPLLPHLVLWFGMAGAALAVRRGGHIAIDLLPAFLSPAVHRRVAATGSLAAALVSAALAGAAALFVSNEAGLGTFFFARLPLWPLLLVFPFFFALMALRFLVAVFTGKAGVGADASLR